MWTESYCRAIGRRPGLVIVSLTILSLTVGLSAPDLTRLVAAKPARLLPEDAESRRAVRLMNATWPDQAAVSLVVVSLRRRRPDSRRPGLRPPAGRRFSAPDRPAAVLGAIGPGATAGGRRTAGQPRRPGTARDRPAVRVIRGAGRRGSPRLAPGPRCGVAAAGGPGRRVVRRRSPRLREFMDSIRSTLDRAALATVVLILIVLLLVYRSVWLALVPLITIGLSLAMARGLLGWIVQAGWDVSVLLEPVLNRHPLRQRDGLLLLTWRFAERWDRGDPAEAMASTLSRIWEPLLTARDGHCRPVADGRDAIRTVLAHRAGRRLGAGGDPRGLPYPDPCSARGPCRRRPGGFLGAQGPVIGRLDENGRSVLARPVRVAVAVLLAMGVPAGLGLRATIVYDLLAVLPNGSAAVRDFHQLADSFGSGAGAAANDHFGVRRRPAPARRPGPDRRAEPVAGGRGQFRPGPLGDSADWRPRPVGCRPGRGPTAIRGGLDRISQGSDELSRGLNEGVTKARLAQGDGRDPPDRPAQPEQQQTCAPTRERR